MRRSYLSLSPVPAAVLATVTAATCPTCLGALFGFLSAVGMSVTESWYFIPLLSVLHVLGLVGLALSAKRSPWLMAAAVAGSLLVFGGRFVLHEAVVMYLGVLMLLASSAWSFWRRRRRTALASPAPTAGQTGTPAISS